MQEMSAQENPKTNRLTRNIVKDINAPLYYSEKTIWAFCMLFSVVFGAALLSWNLRDKGKVKWLVWGYGIVYTAVVIAIVLALPMLRIFVMWISLFGGWMMTQLFWDSYIGAETKYRQKPVWRPMVIAIILVGLLVFAAIYNSGME